MRLKIFILPVTVTATIVLIIFYVKPLLLDAMSARENLQANQTRLAELETQNQKLQAIKSEYDNLGDERTLVETALPEKEEIDAYVSELFSKTSRSGILLSGINYTENSPLNQGNSILCSDTSQMPPAPSNAATAAAPGGLSPDAAGVSTNCPSILQMEMTGKGSWEQTLEFFKYLEDMNRISSIEEVTIGTQKQTAEASQGASDLLNIGVTAKAYFKEKKQTGNMALAGVLARQNGFDKGAIGKIKEIVYSPYAAPSVSSGADRNIFK